MKRLLMKNVIVMVQLGSSSKTIQFCKIKQLSQSNEFLKESCFLYDVKKTRSRLTSYFLKM